jgi:hypothetical protein
MLRFRGQFLASAPDGVRYTLVWWAEDGGVLTVETCTGEPVVRVGSGRYQLSRPNLLVELVAEDPTAP